MYNKNSGWRKFFGSFFYLGNLKGGGTYTSIITGILIFCFIDWKSIEYILLLSISFIIILLLSYNIQGDPSWFTLDELLGTILTFFFHEKSIPTLIVGLTVFRLFDIFKLPFVRKVEKLKYGIILDDIIAGILAWLFLWFSQFFRIY